VGTVTNIRTEKANICQIFLRKRRDPHREPWAAKAGVKQRFVQAAPKRAALQGARAALALLSALGSSLLGRLGIQSTTGQIYP